MVPIAIDEGAARRAQVGCHWQQNHSCRWRQQVLLWKLEEYGKESVRDKFEHELTEELVQAPQCFSCWRWWLSIKLCIYTIVPMCLLRRRRCTVDSNQCHWLYKNHDKMEWIHASHTRGESIRENGTVCTRSNAASNWQKWCSLEGLRLFARRL